MLEACPILDALITRIPADEEPLCGNAAVYAIIVIIITITITIIIYGTGNGDMPCRKLFFFSMLSPQEIFLILDLLN